MTALTIGRIEFAPSDPDRPGQCQPMRSPSYSVERSAERIRTHWDGCWRSHPECAQARLERLLVPGSDDSGEQFTGGTSRFAAVQDEE